MPSPHRRSARQCRRALRPPEQGSSARQRAFVGFCERRCPPTRGHTHTRAKVNLERLGILPWCRSPLCLGRFCVRSGGATRSPGRSLAMDPPAKPAVDKQSLCIDILVSGHVQAYVDFFYLTQCVCTHTSNLGSRRECPKSALSLHGLNDWFRSSQPTRSGARRGGGIARGAGGDPLSHVAAGEDTAC